MNQIRSHAFALRLFLLSAFRIPNSDFLLPSTILFIPYILHPIPFYHSLLRMQMPREVFLAVRFGVQYIMFLKGLQLMQKKHQHEAD